MMSRAFGEDLAEEFHGGNELVQQDRSAFAYGENEVHALSLVGGFWGGEPTEHRLPGHAQCVDLAELGWLVAEDFDD
jgi:hypothetical protein